MEIIFVNEYVDAGIAQLDTLIVDSDLAQDEGFICEQCGELIAASSWWECGSLEAYASGAVHLDCFAWGGIKTRYASESVQNAAFMLSLTRTDLAGRK